MKLSHLQSKGVLICIYAGGISNTDNLLLFSIGSSCGLWNLYFMLLFQCAQSCLLKVVSELLTVSVENKGD